MKIITPQEINRILAVTDALGLHREAVMVQLDFVAGGRVGLWAGRKVDITAPDDVPLDRWLADLPAKISALDLAGVRRSDG
jgi:hypothetical protein